jgi:hypothetical protein
MADEFRKNKLFLTPVMRRICQFANRRLTGSCGKPIQNVGKSMRRQEIDGQTPPKTGIEPELFTIGWYPSNRSCANTVGRRMKPQQMPPLMVRKPEWRR